MSRFNSMFNSYADVAQWYTKARNPEAGRPIGTWGRIMREGTHYNFYVHRGYNKEPFAVVKPDNTITFLYTGTQVRRVSNTLVGWLWRVFPLNIQRVAKCRYKIVHEKTVPGNVWFRSTEHGYEIYPGIVFDLATGACLNPKMVDRPTEIDPDRRKVWLRDLRKFKAYIKVCIRLGTFDAIIDKMSSEEQVRQTPDWTEKQWLDLLEGAIKDKQYPEKFMRAIVNHAYTRMWMRRRVKAEEIYSTVDDICTIASLDMRLRYGVIKEIVNE